MAGRVVEEALRRARLKRLSSAWASLCCACRLLQHERGMAAERERRRAAIEQLVRRQEARPSTPPNTRREGGQSLVMLEGREENPL